MSLSLSKQDSLGGLHHLMEAATALSDLVHGNSSTSARMQCSNYTSAVTSTTRQSKRVVSDDEEENGAFHNTECPQSPAPSVVSASSFVAVNNKEIFPQRLMHILSQPSISHIITWLPQGRSFVIIDPDVFASKILPQFFSETTSSSNISPSSSSSAKSKNKKSTACKYPSFTRKLNRWGFRQISRGPDAGAFHHPLFQRENPNLCLEMVCQKSRRPTNSKSKIVNDSGACDSPDTSKLRPLQSMSCLPMKREVSMSTVTDSDSYAPETKALPPKKRKLRCMQESEFGQNHHYPLPQESLSISLNKSHRNPEQIIFKPPLHMKPSTLKPMENYSHSESVATSSALKKHELPSFHKSYLDSGAAQERSKEISEFLEKNLIELQRFNKALESENATASQVTPKNSSFEKPDCKSSDPMSSVLHMTHEKGFSSLQHTGSLQTSSTATSSQVFVGLHHTQRNNSKTDPSDTVLPKTIKDAKDNLYRAYLQALSS